MAGQQNLGYYSCGFRRAWVVLVFGLLQSYVAADPYTFNTCRDEIDKIRNGTSTTPFTNATLDQLIYTGPVQGLDVTRYNRSLFLTLTYEGTSPNNTRALSGSQEGEPETRICCADTFPPW
jgi:hypothetical protein